MAPIQATEDYYALLEIDQDANISVIRSSYRRLAKLRHPDKAQDRSKATAEFQLLQQAYSTLSDPEERRSYDQIYITIRKIPKTKQANRSPNADKTTSQTTGPTSTRWSDPYLETRLKILKNSQMFQMKLVTVEREELRRLQDELQVLQLVEEFNTTMDFPRSHLAQSEDEKTIKERERLDRVAAITVKKQRLNERSIALRKCEELLRDIENQVSAVQQEIRVAEKQRKEQAEKEERERQAAAAAAAAAAHEQMERENRRRTEFQSQPFTRSRAFQSWEWNTRPPVTGSCTHQGYWPRIQGRHECSGCLQITPWFAYECSLCGIAACGWCREPVKQEALRAGKY